MEAQRTASGIELEAASLQARACFITPGVTLFSPSA